MQDLTSDTHASHQQGKGVSRRHLLRTGVIASGGIVAAACTSQVAPSPSPSAVTSAAPAVTTVINQGQLVPAPADAKPSGWDTAESLRGKLKLFAKFDDSGPAAWDVATHPLVFITSEGQGYSHRPSKSEKLVGFQIIDATTKQIVAAPQFDLGWKQYGTPHGLGVSPNGQWIYFPSTDNTASGNSAPSGESRLFIVNAKTLKLNKLLTYPNRGFHHVMAYKDTKGQDRVLVQTQFPNGAKFILDPNDDNRVVKALTLEDVGYPFGHPYSTIDPTGQFLYIGLATREMAAAEGAAGVAKVDLDKGTATLILGMMGGWPLAIAHTADGKFSYVNDADKSLIYKIDNKTNTFVGKTSAGVAGPYGLTFNWDETELWSLGKGEGSHNTGGVIGIIDTKLFSPSRTAEYNQPIEINGAIIDHVILHPDPAVNEMWVTSAGTWETIVVDQASKTVKKRIPSPHGGDTHSGAFVRYQADFTGELLADMGGPMKPMYALRKEKAAAAAAK